MINHHQLAKASGEVYHQQTHAEGSAEAAISTFDDENYIVAFRGTEKDGKDILTDLRTIPWYDGNLNAWCHSGFLKTTRPLFDVMWGDVYNIAHQGNKIHFTGHSLGAARAAIFAALFCTVWKNKGITLTLFGCPPPQFGHGLEKWLAGVPVAIYKHGSDFVFSHPIFGSQVNPRVVQIGRSDTVARSLSQARWLDHRITNYIMAMS